MERGLVFEVKAGAVITLAIDESTEMTEADIARTLAKHLMVRLRDWSPEDTIDSFKLIAVAPL